MTLSETATADLAEASASVIAEVEGWEQRHWLATCEVHRQPSNATHLALHIASRSRRVVRAISEQPGSQLDVAKVHSESMPVSQQPDDVVAALKEARGEALTFVAGLDDSSIKRLRAAEIDGEPDALMATCGLTGHWTFHFPAIQAIRGEHS